MTLQEDTDPKHTSRSTLNYVRTKKGNTEDVLGVLLGTNRRDVQTTCDVLLLTSSFEINNLLIDYFYLDPLSYKYLKYLPEE